MRIDTAILLFLTLIALAVNARADSSFRIVQDHKTGITIGLPFGLLSVENETSLGRSWRSSDGSVKIDVFSLAPKKLRDVHQNIRGIRGRVAKRNEVTSDSFVLEGYDHDGSQFYVAARQIANAVKGFSIVYTKSRVETLRPVLSKIIDSFEPAGATKSAKQPRGIKRPLNAKDVKSGMRLQVHGVEQADKLNIREFANAKSASLGELANEETGLIATGRTSQTEGDAWVEIRRGEKSGWVNARFVRQADTQEPAQPQISNVPAQAPPQPPETKVADPIGDCNSESRERRLRGCTELINTSDTPPQVRALAQSRRADSHLEAGTFDNAIKDLTESSKLQPDEELIKKRLSFAYYMRGLSHSRAKRHDEAIADYGQAIAMDAKNDRAFVARANTYADQGKIDAAIGDLANWLNFGINSTDVRELLADLYKTRALSLLKEQKYTSAADDCTAAIAVAPARMELRLIRASIRLAQQEASSAIADADLVLAKEPTNVRALQLRAEAWNSAEDFVRAIDDYSKVLEAQPKNASVLLSRGLAYERLERFTDAEADYKKVLRLEPKNETASRNLKRLAAFAKWRKSGN